MKPPLPLPLKNKAFTLVELLTVIAIIGILAAILIPVVGKVRAAGQKSACASNLRQIGTALSNYAADNRGTLPGYEKIKDKDGEFYGLVSSAGPQWYVENGKPTRALASQLSAYLSINQGSASTGIAKIFVCPSSPTAGDAIPAASYYMATQVLTSSGVLKRPFAFNGVRSLRYNEIANPPKAVALFDLDVEGAALIGVTLTASASVPEQSVHGATRNVLYFDGHVAAVAKNINPQEKL